MKIKALTSFSGVVSMRPDEERDVTAAVAKDLIRAGYAVAVKGQPEPEIEPEPEPDS